MRVVSFNILHGRSPGDGRVDAGRLRAAVRELDPDVLGLQEVDRDQPRSQHLDLTEIAAAAMGATERRFVPALRGTPGQAWTAARDDSDDGPPGHDPGGPQRGPADGGAGDRSGPGYGCALLTRLPVRDWRALRLPAAPLSSPVAVHGRPVLIRDEPRVAVVAVCETASGPLTVAATHLSFVPGYNALQFRRLLRRLGAFPAFPAFPAPRLLLGDLNLPGRLPRLLSGWTPLARVATYPTNAPRTQLDHVLWRGASVPTILSYAAHPLPLSDHRALVVDLAI